MATVHSSDGWRGWFAGSVRRGALVALATAFVASPLVAARVEIVLDASGSMRAAVGGVTKMEAAQEAVKATVAAIDPSSNVALRLYGHRLPSEPKQPSCEDIELVIPFGPLDKQRFVAAVEAARPLGQTPLAASLELAAADFDDLGDEAAVVILVSDGEESCGGDPAALACAFAERGIDLTVHTVGFDVDAVARQQLQEIATCTGGEYHDARDADELGESLRQLTQAGLLVDKEREALGREIRGGDGFASAVTISPGTFRLDHHQRKGEYDYFSIEVSPGHLLRVTQEAYEVGVSIRGDSFTEDTHYSGAGVAVHGPDRKRISADHLTISAGDQAEAEVAVSSSGGGLYYILVGQNIVNIHKDSPITVEIVDQSDAGSGTDVSDSESEAVPIRAGEHRAWLQGGDEGDMFTFVADPAAAFSLRVRPEERGTSVSVSVRDDDGVVLASASSPNKGASVRLSDQRVERRGPVYVLVQYPNRYEVHPSPYTLELSVEGGAVTAETAPQDLVEEGDEEVAPEPAEEPSAAEEAAPRRIGCVAALVLLLLVGTGATLAVVMTRRKRGKAA